MREIERRIERLEQQVDAEAIRVVVDWSEDPQPPGPGVLVVEWPDGEDGSEP